VKKMGKNNAPQAPKAPQVVFSPSGESRVAGRSVSSPQDKPLNSITQTLTSGKSTRILHAPSSTIKLAFDIYNHQKQAIDWKWHKYQ
jgi:hypothetical protein